MVAIGECLNYLFDPEHRQLSQVFQRIYHALSERGVFIFDIAEPGQVTSATPVQSFTEGEDWLVLLEKQENPEHHILTRRIITFRQVGAYYRRDDEVHRQQLYQAEEIAQMLQQVSFEVQVDRGYGEFVLPPAHAVLVARKASHAS